MKKRIFLVDDEPDVTHLLRLTLEHRGHYRVGEENEPARAVAAVRAFDPDLILLDIMMPDVDGCEVADRLRRDPVLRDVPVLFMTALVGPGDAPAGHCTSGGHTFLPKSLPPGQLIAHIEGALAGSELAMAV